MSIFPKLGSLVKSTFFGLGLTLGASAALPTEAEAARPAQATISSHEQNLRDAKVLEKNELDRRIIRLEKGNNGDIFDGLANELNLFLEQPTPSEMRRSAHDRTKDQKKQEVRQPKQTIKIVNKVIKPYDGGTEFESLGTVGLKYAELKGRRIAEKNRRIEEENKKIEEENKRIEEENRRKIEELKKFRRIAEENRLVVSETRFDDSGRIVMDVYTDQKFLKKLEGEVLREEKNVDIKNKKNEIMSAYDTTVSIQNDVLNENEKEVEIIRTEKNQKVQRRYRPNPQQKQKKSDPAKPLIIQIAGQNGKVIRKPTSPLPDTTNNRQNDTQMVENLELICKQENPELNTTNNKSREETTYQEPICESEESFTELTSRGEYKVTIKTSTRR